MSRTILVVLVGNLLSCAASLPQQPREMRNCEGKDLTKVKVDCPSVHYCICVDVEPPKKEAPKTEGAKAAETETEATPTEVTTD